MNDYLLLGPVELGSKEINPEGLSKYEKFLVHQIIRQDYPQLITIPRRGAIQVSALDEAREAAIVKSKMRDIQGRIYRQIGFRWVIEALAGQSLRHIDLATFTTDPQTGDTMPISFDVKSRFQRCQALLEGRPRPIIGHNMFLDLVYLYKTFIGLLPDKVADFAAKLHELFPVIVDTKYLATHKCGDINPMSSLQQLAEKMDRQKTPLISTEMADRTVIPD
ncbi:hypothetical protein ANO11243_052610 [Dothideomycetidae sp. 11243]|nr:hypothetical protein ANO11243_052610 [fungal sp. No.11243]